MACNVGDTDSGGSDSDNNCHVGDTYSGGSDFEDGDSFDEESILRYYFSRRFDYQEILSFLRKQHGSDISYRTLLRRLKMYSLHRRHKDCDVNLQAKHDLVGQRITEMVDEPESAGGYRTLWHSLQMEGLSVPRAVVRSLLKEIDPVGTETRKGHKLRRRKYENPGPNYA